MALSEVVPDSAKASLATSRMCSRVRSACARTGPCAGWVTSPPGALGWQRPAGETENSPVWSAWCYRTTLRYSSTLGVPVHYLKLGRSGLDVSPIAIGAMTYGEPGRGHPVWSLGEQASRPLIRHALEAGLNFFDTANLYSLGSSEEILGRALADYADRDDMVICTKVRHPMRPGPNGAGLSRKAIMTEIDHSLRRLGTDYVDVYMIHRLDQSTPLEETLEALSDVVKAGKARYLGASSMKAFEFARALHLQDQHGWARFITMQDHYNLLAREEEREMLPLCASEGVGTMVWSPLARGLLARDPAAATARSQADPFADMLYPGLTRDSDRAIVDA